MAIVSFKNENPLQSGQACVWKAELADNRVTLWFQCSNGKLVREGYRLYKAEDVQKLQAAVKAVLGEVPEAFDTDSLIGKHCCVRLEERPWREGQNWIGVAEVTPCTTTKRPVILKSIDDKKRVDDTPIINPDDLM